MGIIPKWMKFASGGYDSISSAYFARMTTQPSVDLKKVIDTYFVKNKKTVNGNVITANSIIAKADVIYLPFINNSNDSFKNLVKNAHHGVRPNEDLVHESLWGWSNPKGTGYVDTNYNPATQGVNHKLNDAFICAFVDNLHLTPDFNCVMGCGASTYTGITKVSASGVRGNINSSNTVQINSVPFMRGLFGFRRTTNLAGMNQNVTNVTGSYTGSTIPSVNISLFGLKTTVFSLPHYGSINFVYIGASLSDDEFTALNLIVNECLKQCLYLKYGASNWGVQMAKSYFDTLHNFEPYEAWEVYEFIKRHQSDYVDSAGTGYLYNTFGPSGQNKVVADYIMLFKAGGNLVSNAWIKTGVTLRWNQDGGIATSNTMPAYTRGTNLGIVTVASTDGWNGVTAINLTQTGNSVNAFYGNIPIIFGLLKTGGAKCSLNISSHRAKIKMDNYPLASLLNSIAVNMTVPTNIGYTIINTDTLVGGSFTSFDIYSRKLRGNMSLFTNEAVGVTFTIGSDAANRSDELTGTLASVVISNNTVFVQFPYTGITGGTSTWNKSIGTFNLRDCRFSTAAVDAQLKVINDYFAINTPIKNLTVNLSGATMGIPTGGANNTDLLGIVAKHAAAGFVATITVRTS